MTYSILIFAYRKPGTTPEQFRAHYEGKHVPLIKEISGEYVPALRPSTLTNSLTSFSRVRVHGDETWSLKRRTS